MTSAIATPATTDPTSLEPLVVHLHRVLVAEGGDPDRRGIEARIRVEAPLLGDDEVETVSVMVQQRLFGLGPLDPLMADPSISEVMINGPGPVWIERAGRLEATDIVLDHAALRLIIDRVTGPLGLRLDRVVPFADARLADGSRVHVTIPPMAIDGPYVTIRRFASQVRELAEFGGHGVAGLLDQAVGARANILVSGATGAGKTSLIGALAAGIDRRERVVTIEDAAELRLPGDHVVRLEARPPNAEGVGEVTIRSLVRNALRMRPDRLIVGEVRGAEALEMIQALNTGHAGSLSTCHANSPTDALGRLTAMALMSDVAIPSEVLAAQIRSAIDLVVHVVRGAHGRRTVGEIVAVGPSEGHDQLLVSSGALTDAASGWALRDE